MSSLPGMDEHSSATRWRRSGAGLTTSVLTPSSGAGWSMTRRKRATNYLRCCCSRCSLGRPGSCLISPSALGSDPARPKRSALMLTSSQSSSGIGRSGSSASTKAQPPTPRINATGCTVLGAVLSARTHAAALPDRLGERRDPGIRRRLCRELRAELSAGEERDLSHAVWQGLEQLGARGAAGAAQAQRFDQRRR